MERKAILVESMGAPKHVVQQIQTRPRTTTICPLCKRRFKKDDPTVLVDLVRRFCLTSGKNKEPDQNSPHPNMRAVCPAGHSAAAKGDG